MAKLVKEEGEKGKIVAFEEGRPGRGQQGQGLHARQEDEHVGRCDCPPVGTGLLAAGRSRGAEQGQRSQDDQGPGYLGRLVRPID